VANKTNLSIGAVIVLLIAAYFGIDLQENQLQTSTPSVAVEPSTQTSQPKNQVLDGTAKIAQAFQSQVNEMHARVAVLNKFTELGRPHTQVAT